MTSSADDTRSTRERMLAGELYIADDPELTAMHERRARADRGLQRDAGRQPRGAGGSSASCSARSARTPRSARPSTSTTATHITIGARCFANYGLVALDVAPITIGDDVQIGPNVQLLTPTHPVEPGPRRDKWEAAQPITIGDNVWLGGGVIVLPGVTIGDNTVVGAGAVVTKDLPANVVAVGNPARVVRTLE